MTAEERAQALCDCVDGPAWVEGVANAVATAIREAEAEMRERCARVVEALRGHVIDRWGDNGEFACEVGPTRAEFAEAIRKLE